MWEFAQRREALGGIMLYFPKYPQEKLLKGNYTSLRMHWEYTDCLVWLALDLQAWSCVTCSVENVWRPPWQMRCPWASCCSWEFIPISPRRRVVCCSPEDLQTAQILSGVSSERPLLGLRVCLEHLQGTNSRSGPPSVEDHRRSARINSQRQSSSSLFWLFWRSSCQSKVWPHVC